MPRRAVDLQPLASPAPRPCLADPRTGRGSGRSPSAAPACTRSSSRRARSPASFAHRWRHRACRRRRSQARSHGPCRAARRRHHERRRVRGSGLRPGAESQSETHPVSDSGTPCSATPSRWPPMSVPDPSVAARQRTARATNRTRPRARPRPAPRPRPARSAHSADRLGGWRAVSTGDRAEAVA